MATKKISELEAINAAEDNDVLVIVDTSESTTNKITKGNLLIGAGHTIEMTLNENYQIVLVLKNAAGTALSTQTIDLPNENAVTNLAYNNGILTVTKQSGATSQINLTGLIEGLVTESDFNTFKEALQATLEAINEKDAEQDEAIAENYKVINKLKSKLENQQKVIDQLPQVTGQGTAITLEDTIEAPFTKFDVEGNSEQESTKGYQLLKYLTEGTKSFGGINLKIDENGYLYITGSNTYTSYITLLSFTMVANQAYTIDETGCTNDLKISWANVNTFTSDAHRTYTPTADTETAIQLIIPANTNYNNYKMKIFLYEGSYDSGKKLEPYTNGASPNPNYEQPIYSAGDNENLFDITTAINGYIGTNGALSKNDDWKLSQYIEVKNNSSYTMSRSDGTRQSFVITEYDENKTFIKRNEQGLQPVGVNSPYTITTGASTKYIRINYNNTFQATTIKLEKGNKASGYSPYGMGSINEKIQTRNVFKNLPNTLDNYSIVMNNDGKKITFKGTNSSSTFYPSFIFYADGSVATSQWHPTKQQIDKSKGYFTKTGIAYILSLLKSGTFSGSNPSFFIGKETTFTSSGIFANVDTYTTQIANNSEKVNFIAIGFTPSQQVDLTFKIQLEPGSTESSYVPHEEQDYSIFVQQPFRSIGDVRDKFVKVNSNWYERHYIGEKILNGTENWREYSSNMYLYIEDFILSEGQNNYVPTNYLSDHFTRNSLTNAIANPNASYLIQNVWGNRDKQRGVAIRVNDTFTDLATLKTWLTSHNTKLQYELEEPLDLPCTQAQIQQLENLPSTYKDFTIIQSEDETPAYLEVSGIRDINTMFDKVTNAIVSLGGNV